MAGKLLSDSKVAASFENTITRLEAVVTRLDKGEGSLGKLSVDPALYNNLNQVSANLKPITAHVSQGQGTVGKLFKDQELYDNSNKVMKEVLLLVQDIRKDPKKYLRIRFSIF
jgi:phospholipid/cholesterol/gamma-HCH transport system substrate-binding protein